MLSDKSRLLIFLYAIVPLTSALITLLTGSLVYWYGGFPLYWRTPYFMAQPCVAGSCPMPPSFYDWSWREINYWPGFFFDLLFYTAIGYSLLFGYVVYDQPRQALRPTTQECKRGIAPRLQSLSVRLLQGKILGALVDVIPVPRRRVLVVW